MKRRKDGYAGTGTQGTAVEALPVVRYLPGGLDSRQCDSFLRYQNQLTGKARSGGKLYPWLHLWCLMYVAENKGDKWMVPRRGLEPPRGYPH